MKKVITIKKTTENCTPIVVDAIKSAPKNSVIKFEKGTYHFYPEGAHVGMFYPSNNKSSIKTVIFPILEKDGLTIDGNGSDFLFHGRVYPFIAQKSNNVVYKNFTIDFPFPPNYQAVVVDSTDEYIDFYIDKSKYPYEIKNGNMICHAELEDISSATLKFFISDFDKVGDEGTQITSMMLGDCSMNMEFFPNDVLRVDASEIGGDVVHLTYRKGSPKLKYFKGHNIVVHYDEERDNGIFFFDDVNGAKLNNVRIYRGAGMGIVAQTTENISFDKFYIKAKEGRNDLITTTADALQFINCTGKVVMKNSCIERSLDDGLNLHGIYTLVYKVIDSHVMVAKLGHREQLGFNPYKTGDVIDIIDKDTLDIKAKLTIESAEVDSNIQFLNIKIKEEIPSNLKVDDFMENPNRMPEMHFYNNRFYKCPSIMFSSSKKTVFKNNYVENRGAAFRIPDGANIWCESGRVHDVLVKGNKFFNCAEMYDEYLIYIGNSANKGNTLRQRVIQRHGKTNHQGEIQEIHQWVILCKPILHLNHQRHSRRQYHCPSRRYIPIQLYLLL